MKSAGILENADQLKNIMAKEISLARERRSNQAVYRASAKLSRNLTVEAKARDFTFYIDEPASFGGADKGPNPEEVVLAAVGACQAITAALYAALLGIEIKRYEVNLKGYLDPRRVLWDWRRRKADRVRAHGM